jgi:hypothetical protein
VEDEGFHPMATDTEREFSEERRLPPASRRARLGCRSNEVPP